MQYWRYISCLLCIYGFLREMRPADPYYIEYLVKSESLQLNEEEVNKKIVPLLTYSYMAQLVIIFLVTDYYRYKPIILITSAAGAIGYGILVFATSKNYVIISNVFFGTFLSGEIAYYTYIYSKVDREYYSTVTSHTRAALLCGKCVACFIAQVTIDLKILHYKDLNLLTLISEVCACLWALRLPRSAKSLYFHRHYSIIDPGKYALPLAQQQLSFSTSVEEDEDVAARLSCISDSEFDQVSTAQLLWIHVRNAYTDKQVLLWSIFFASGMCGYLQVYNYVQVLWRTIGREKRPWNAAVDGLLRLFGAIASFLAGYIDSTRFSKRKLLCIAASLAIVQGVSILTSCLTTILLISYVAYIFFGVVHCLLITIASTEVARRLEGESFALVFGINTFCALVLQSLLTVISVSNCVVSLDVIGQFTIHGSYYITVGVAYFVFETYDFYYSKSRRPTFTAR